MSIWILTLSFWASQHRNFYPAWIHLDHSIDSSLLGRYTFRAIIVEHMIVIICLSVIFPVPYKNSTQPSNPYSPIWSIVRTVQKNNICHHATWLSSKSMLALDWESMERERFMGFSWMSEWRLRLSVWSYDLFVKTCWGLTCFYPRKLHPSQCPSHGTSQPCPLCCLEDLKIRHAALSHGHPGHWCCHLGATMTWPLCTNCNCESRECKGLLPCQPHRFAVLRVNYSPSNTHKQTPWNKQRNFSTTILLNQSIHHLPTLIFNPGSKKKLPFCVRDQQTCTKRS